MKPKGEPGTKVIKKLHKAGSTAILMEGNRQAAREALYEEDRRAAREARFGTGLLSAPEEHAYSDNAARLQDKAASSQGLALPVDVTEVAPPSPESEGGVKYDESVGTVQGTSTSSNTSPLIPVPTRRLK